MAAGRAGDLHQAVAVVVAVGPSAAQGVGNPGEVAKGIVGKDERFTGLIDLLDLVAGTVVFPAHQPAVAVPVLYRKPAAVLHGGGPAQGVGHLLGEPAPALEDSFIPFRVGYRNPARGGGEQFVAGCISVGVAERAEQPLASHLPVGEGHGPLALAGHHFGEGGLGIALVVNRYAHQIFGAGQAALPVVAESGAPSVGQGETGAEILFIEGEVNGTAGGIGERLQVPPGAVAQAEAVTVVIAHRSETAQIHSGHPVKTLVKRRPFLDVEPVVTVVDEAVEYAHRRPGLHRLLRGGPAGSGKGEALPRTFAYPNLIALLLQEPFVGEAPAAAEDAAPLRGAVVAQGQANLRAQAPAFKKGIADYQVQGGGVDPVAGQAVSDAISRPLAAEEAGKRVLIGPAVAAFRRQSIIVVRLPFPLFLFGSFTFFSRNFGNIGSTGFRKSSAQGFSGGAGSSGRRAARSAQQGAQGGDDRDRCGAGGAGMPLPGLFFTVTFKIPVNIPRGRLRSAGLLLPPCAALHRRRYPCSALSLQGGDLFADRPGIVGAARVAAQRS